MTNDICNQRGHCWHGIDDPDCKGQPGPYVGRTFKTSWCCCRCHVIAHDETEKQIRNVIDKNA